MTHTRDSFSWMKTYYPKVKDEKDITTMKQKESEGSYTYVKQRF